MGYYLVRVKYQKVGERERGVEKGGKTYKWHWEFPELI